MIEGTTENSNLLETMCMAEWMLYTGKTSDDWYNMPIGDVKLLTMHIISRRNGMKRDLGEVIGRLFGGGRSTN